MAKPQESRSKQKVLLKPKYDVVFQSLFSDKNRKETGYFISAILGRKIKVIKVDTEVSELRELPKEKVGRLDLIAQTEENEIVHIELQLINYFNTIPRLIYSLSQLISKQLSRGEDYSKLKRTITIGLIDYELEELKDINKMHTIWSFRENKVNEKELTKLQELHIIEMKKAKKEYEKNPNNILAQWIMFILNPNEVEVKSIMKDNEELNETNETLEIISDDEHLKKRAEILERWEREEKWNRASLREHATKEGREKGIKEGLKEGIKEGRKEEKIKIAKEMLKKSLDQNLILEVTGLTKEEMELILKNQ